MAQPVLPRCRTKLGRGELFECLDMLAAVRASVALYRQLRGDTPALVRRTSAEAASLD
ncbi:MAG: hypothetical protein ACRDOD_06750 [Streptosporangiaceae bacterium]